jgi:hypothetical protein
MKKLWEQPWSYKESFLAAIFLLILGFITELVTTQKGIHLPGFPMNMYIGLSFIVFLSFLWIFYKTHPFVKWLSSIPAAISSISLVTFMALLLGIISQDNPEKQGFLAAIGLTHAKNSWPMVFSQLFVLTSLGLVVMRRATPVTRKNLGFFMNHFGLWLVIASASLGAGDFKRYRMNLTKGETIWYAFDNARNPVELPFALRLDNFTIDEYLPKLAVYDARTGELIKDGKNLLISPIDTINPHIAFQNWNVEIKQFIESAEKTEDGYVSSDKEGSAPAAYLSIKHLAQTDIIEGWVSCGSFNTEGEYLWLSPMTVLVMTVPEARRYASDLTVFTRNAEPYGLTIEVNKAPKIEGWRVYQLSYDQSKGKWSDLSVLEVIRDPWLPVVYTGIFLLLAGALYIFWIGKDIKE